MSSIVNSHFDWLRRYLPWPRSLGEWLELVILVCLLAWAVGLCGLNIALSWILSLGMWLVVAMTSWVPLLLVAALLEFVGLIKLFGPVLRYDLVRTARRSRYFFIRTVYGIFMLFVLSCIFLAHQRHGSIPAHRMSEFAESFFFAFLFVQLVVLVVLTPAYTAGAIADEKERRTLEFILATDLRNREVVLSKFLSRLANLTLVILTGLPILAILLFAGGIDPNHVLAGFAATALTVASLAALSIFWSVHSRKPRDAIVLTYLTPVAYLIAGVLFAVLAAIPGVGSWSPVESDSLWYITVEDVVNVFNSGNLLTALVELGMHWGKPTHGETLLLVLRNYAIFHGLLIGVCMAWSMARIRAVALKERSTSSSKAARSFRVKHRPRVGQSPMLWKEIFAEPGFRFPWFGRIVVYVLVILSFVPAVTVICSWIVVNYYYEDNRISWNELGLVMNAASVRSVGTIVACLMLLSVAVRAATSVSSERERETFDSLLTTPLDSNAILFSKWLGSLLSMRWAWLWLGAIWGLGVITGGLHILALPLLLAAWTIYAAFVTSLGTWFSIVSRSSLRAVVWTLLTITFLGVAHWILWIPLLLIGHVGRDFDFLWKFELWGLTPPVPLWLLAFQGREFETDWRMADGVEFAIYAGVGLFFWAGAALALWFIASNRFRHMTGRAHLLHPKGQGEEEVVIENEGARVE